VLFVDYIAEHLSAKGRAAVIVPEGIIFQSGKAYKQLRKMLVENYVVAVVSLPVGAFNPYSGVKTSILFMDKPLAKKTGDILFVKIENDGYDLGAQRRPIDKNDLPETAWQVKAYFDAVRSNAVQDMEFSADVLAVDREQINENVDWSLNSELYRETEDIRQSDWPMVKLGEVATVSAGNSAPQDKNLFQDGTHPFCRTADVGKAHISPNFTEISDHLNEQGISGLRLSKKGTILFPKSGASTFLNHRVMLGRDSYVSSHLATINADKHKINEHFLFYLLCEIDAKNITAEQNYPSLRLSEIKNIVIPLPPLGIQREIIAEINGYQKIIDGARQVVETYTPHIPIDSAWPMVELEEVCNFIRGVTFKKSDSEFKKTAENLPILRAGNIGNHLNTEDNLIWVSKALVSKEQLLQVGDIVICMSSGSPKVVGKTALLKNDWAGSVGAFCGIIRAKNQEQSKYLFLWFQSPSYFQWRDSQARGVSIQNLRFSEMDNLKIPLPPPAEQKRIIAKIEEEEKLIDANRTLIRTFEQKIKAKIATVWGEN